MILFYLLALLLAFFVALWLMMPWWRSQDTASANLLSLNKRVFNERLAELDQDEQQGRMDAATAQELRTELQRNLLALEPAAALPTSARHPRGLWLLPLSLPVLSLLFYSVLMAPDGLGSWWTLRKDMAPAVDRLMAGSPPSAEEAGQHSLQDFIRVLQARLQQQPNNAQGWFVLGMSYVQLDLGAPALTAFEHAWRLSPEEPRYAVAYAQTRLMASDGQLDGQSREILEQVLQRYPEHEGALALLGFSAFRTGEYALAVSNLERLQSVRQRRHAANPDSSFMSQIDQALLKARAGLKTAAAPASVAASPASIQVRVKVDRKLVGQYRPDDVVYVFARALNGPPMPLAVVRRRAAELPFTVDLDDSQSPMPTARLSSVKEVAVSARISRHGSPESRPGDMEAVPVPVRLVGPLQQVDLLIQTIR